MTSLPKLVIVCPSYHDILELTLFCIYSERNLGKPNILIAEMWLCFVISVYKMNRKLWGDDIINSLICIFISTGQEMFLENLWNFWNLLKPVPDFPFKEKIKGVDLPKWPWNIKASIQPCIYLCMGKGLSKFVWIFLYITFRLHYNVIL